MRCFALLLPFFSIAWGKMRYDGYPVFDITPQTDEHLDLLRNIANNLSGLNFLSDFTTVNKSFQIMVSPHVVQDFKDMIGLLGVKSEIYVENVQKLIDREESERRNAKNDRRNFDWTDYYELSEINTWLQSLATRFPQAVRVVKGGRSYEGRDILGVHISYSASNANKAVFIEGGMHAGEWISPATVTFFLNSLLTSENATIRSIAKSYDWYFFPVVNPDGYEYTHTTNRFWRKTRVPYGKCYGADPNRNWGYKWNQGGASNDPCNDHYVGPYAFSEPCTRSLSKFISSIGTNLQGFISFHSHSQLLLTPYGHTKAHLDNYDELHAVGAKAVKALARRYGTKYDVGNIAERLYVVTGGSMDWVKATYKPRISYTYGLSDKGQFGFLLPIDQILPNCLEVLDSLVEIFLGFK